MAELGLPGVTEAAIVVVAAETLWRPINLVSLLGVVAVVGGSSSRMVRGVLLGFFLGGSFVGELHVSLLLPPLYIFVYVYK